MHLHDTLLFLVLALAAVSLPVALARLMIVKSKQWEIVAEGIVGSIEVEDVPFSTDPAEHAFPLRQAVRTVLTFDHGEQLYLLGNYLSDCKAGDVVYVHRNKLGDYRIERRV